MTSKTDEQIVRGFIKDAFVDHLIYRGCTEGELIAALDRLLARTIPELPENVMVHSMQQYHDYMYGTIHCRIVLYRPLGACRDSYQGEGSTIREACLAAIRAIGKGEG